jgi:hypothetical protein
MGSLTKGLTCSRLPPEKNINGIRGWPTLQMDYASIAQLIPISIFTSRLPIPQAYSAYIVLGQWRQFMLLGSSVVIAIDPDFQRAPKSVLVRNQAVTVATSVIPVEKRKRGEPIPRA